eukprot:gene9162-10114_t
MMVSNDFLLRTIGRQDGIILPIHKSDVRDYLLEVILKRIGGQQSFLDLSRCFVLSPRVVNFLTPTHCTNLLYLDLSYTKCDELDMIFQKCLFLEGFVVAGLQLLHPVLTGIGNLHHLQLLSIRSSNIKDIRGIEACSCLRSLDLGYLSLHAVSLSALVSHIRLEELLLDNTCVIDTSIEETITSLPPCHLPELKLLNVQESDFSSHITWFIGEETTRDVYLETVPRRRLFFEAVIRNDIKEMYRLLTSGQDINMRASHDDQSFLTKIFVERCTFPKYKLQTPFLLCHDSISETWRPTALHFAIFFNSVACLQTLVDMGADTEALVYISDVKLSQDQTYLEENALTEGDQVTDEGNSLLRRREVNATQLLEVVYGCRVHRLTEKMIQHNVVNWKQKCLKIHKRLKLTLEFGSFIKKDLKKTLAGDEEAKSPDGRGGRGARPATAIQLVDFDDDGSTMSQSMLGEALDDGENRSQQVVNVVEDGGDLSSVPSFRTIQGGDDPLDNNSNNNTALVEVEGGKKTVRSEILPKRVLSFAWRDHAMVVALTGAPRVLSLHEPITSARLPSNAPPEVESTPKGSWMNDFPKLRTSSTLSSLFSSSGRGDHLRLQSPGKTAATNSPHSTSGMNSPLPQLPLDPIGVQYKVRDISVMGKKSYWLESRAANIAAREAGVDLKHSNTVTVKSNNLGVYSNLRGLIQQAPKVCPREKDLEEDWLAGRKLGDIPHRRKLFMQAVRERMEKKFNDHIS